MIPKQGKYYLVVHGASQAYNVTVHSADCPMLPRMVHAKERDSNPLNNDRWNHYTACQRCIGKAKQVKGGGASGDAALGAGLSSECEAGSSPALSISKVRNG